MITRDNLGRTFFNGKQVFRVVSLDGDIIYRDKKARIVFNETEQKFNEERERAKRQGLRTITIRNFYNNYEVDVDTGKRKKIGCWIKGYHDLRRMS